MKKDFKANLAPKLVKANSIEPIPTAWGQMTNLLDWNDTGEASALFHGCTEPNVRIANHDHEIGLVRIESGRFELITHDGPFTLLPNDTAFLSANMYLENGDESGTFYGFKSRFGYLGNVPKIIQNSQYQCFEALGHKVGIVVASEEVENGICVITIETQPLLAPRSLIYKNADCVFVVRQGSYEFCLDDARIHAMQGDCIFVPRGVCRSFRVISTQSGILDLMAIPGGFDRYLFEVLSLLVTGTATEEDFSELDINHGIRTLDGI